MVKFISNDKRKARENMSPLQKAMGDLVTQNMEKAEVLNDFLPQSSPTSASATPPKLQKAKAATGSRKNHPL